MVVMEGNGFGMGLFGLLVAPRRGVMVGSQVLVGSDVAGIRLQFHKCSSVSLH